jgi:nitrite reductase (cytochrome c-552)
LEDRVRTAQNRFTESRDRAFDAIVQLFTSLETARAEGSTVPEADIAAAQAWAARAGYYLDYITSENSIGFHSPDYFQRVANQALDYARNGQLALLGIEIVVTPQSQDNTDEIADSGLR